MEAQSQIKRTLSRSESIDVVRRLLADGEHARRSSLARAACGHFGFVDACGRAQTAGCIKALRELERAGHFVLPAVHPSGRGKGKTARRLGAPVEPARDVPAQAGDVRGLALIKIDTLDQMRLWNEMMLCEHPQGAGPLVGAQMRYLIGSEHGWLGGLGFAAAALQLADRDQWIGWDTPTRRQHLHRVVGMSRLLIRPSVRCHNLASRVLGMAARGIGADFQLQYGYQPWLLESFVDTEHFAGTSYQAANWLAVGQSQGRGRQDREHEQAKSVKDIYVYVLQPQFRALMGVAQPQGPVALEIAQGLDDAQWAAHEFGRAQLGDQRLNDRLVHSANALAWMPGRAFCGVAQGDVAAVKGYYRLIDKPDDSQVNMEAILAPHRARTVQRMRAHSTVLCIQDGSDLNYSGLAQCEGLGSIGTNQTGARSPGLHLHSTLAVSTEGLPLGVLGAQCSAPIARAEHDDRAACDIPIDEKKTFCWIQGLRECVQVARQLPDTRLVCVMDREADFFELFDEQRASGRVDLLVRAKHDRLTSAQSNLFDCARGSPVKGRMRINVPRQSSRPKKSKQKARTGHPQRTAQVALRYCEIEFRPPAQHHVKQPIKLWVVHVAETHRPRAAEPVEWFLLSTRQITSVEQAQECLRWYCLRWRIEDWHRVLKSGCRIEALQHKTAERLKRAIAINLVIAWRIMLMTLLGRQCPDLPADVMFSDLEIEVLQAYAKKTQPASPPYSAMQYASSLAWAATWVVPKTHPPAIS
jgi:Domain of unknown function (DUF4338)/Transposase DNA-binding/Transposase DDE domain